MNIQVKKGILEVMVLSVLKNDGENYGYALSKEIVAEIAATIEVNQATVSLAISHHI